MKNADSAMYRAKEQGRNTYRFFTEDMHKRAYERLLMENKLRGALSRREFVLHYQPQIDVKSGATVGIEALERFRARSGPASRVHWRSRRNRDDRRRRHVGSRGSV